ncbi:hypothetical protein BSKO_01261 [Bryopsis sp. KO-2023]|nr:hypothetical protein BSKO_01261 [Bryopsis sp. KO-2023]
MWGAMSLRVGSVLARRLRGPHSSKACRNRRLFCSQTTALSSFWERSSYRFVTHRRTLASAAVQASQDGPSPSHSRTSSDLVILKIEGMRCGGCGSTVKQLLEKDARVEEASVNFARGIAAVKLAPNAFTPDTNVLEDFRETLLEGGYSCSPSETESMDASSSSHSEERDAQLQKSTRLLVTSSMLAGICLLGHIPHLWSNAPQWLQFGAGTEMHAILSLIAILGPGRGIVFGGLARLMLARPDMDSLIGLGAACSFGISSIAVLFPALNWPTFFTEPAMLLSVVLLGRALEMRAKCKVSSDLFALKKLLPSAARKVVPSGQSLDISASELVAGDEVLVFPGEMIPADGRVKQGRSSVDGSSMTGEPFPSVKKKNDTVIGGTINLDGELLIEVHKAGRESELAKTIELVEKCQARPPSVQRLADRVSGYFVWGVMACSALTAVVWSTVAEPLLAMQLACNVLVVSCPCALGLATPMSVLAGTSMAARRGIIVRGGEVLEACAKIDTVVFDKTGSLTLGNPSVVQLISMSRGWSLEDVLSTAGAIEARSTHSLAKAIVQACSRRSLVLPTLDEGSFKQDVGGGVRGRLDGCEVLVGSKGWLEKAGVTCSDDNILGDVKDRDQCTQVFVAYDSKMVGEIRVLDMMKPEAPDLLEALEKRGIEHFHIASGDQRGPTVVLARRLGLPEKNIHFGIGPTEKSQFVESLQAKGHQVCFVGDGVNDAAALAQADVGIAVSGGVAAASEAAHMVITAGSLMKIVEALDISKATLRNIKQNLGWAFGYNAFAIPIAAGVLLPINGLVITPTVSAAMMGLSSLTVVTNSLLLRLKGGRYQDQAMQPMGSVTESMSSSDWR